VRISVDYKKSITKVETALQFLANMNFEIEIDSW
jgi:hypothetical protein